MTQKIAGCSLFVVLEVGRTEVAIGAVRTVLGERKRLPARGESAGGLVELVFF